MMKKIALLLLALTVAASLLACGAPAEPTPAPEASAPAQTPADAPAETPAETPEETPAEAPAAAAEEYSMEYKGVTVTLHAPAAPIVEALGEPMNYTEMPSCAFEGLDKTYYYGNLYIDTYPVGEEDFIYDFWFADDSLSTPEGVYIGASQAEAEAAYGAESYNGQNAYIVEKGTGTLTVLIENGTVSSIQYAIKIQ